MQQSTPSYFSDTDTHIPMQEACGRSDKHSVLKCIWKHQYHISCGLYFQAKAQNSTLFLLFDILWSVVCRQVFYLVFYIWRITESSRVPNIYILKCFSKSFHLLMSCHFCKVLVKLYKCTEREQIPVSHRCILT